MDALLLGSFGAAQLSVAVGAALAALVVFRLLQNRLHGKYPPVFEGVPFIGGLLKFAGVSVPVGGGRRGRRAGGLAPRNRRVCVRAIATRRPAARGKRARIRAAARTRLTSQRA